MTTLTATLNTNRGRIVVRLFPDHAPKTVRNHVSNVLTKIHAEGRSEAIVLARRAGMGSEHAPPTVS